jgi:hypothetical protein
MVIGKGQNVDIQWLHNNLANLPFPSENGCKVRKVNVKAAAHLKIAINF